jgi:hypothetical protein
LDDNRGTTAVGAGENPGAAPRWSVPLDRAIFFAVGARLWQFLAGVVSLWIIARFFSEKVQGVYYNFIFLLNIQTFFDLGLTGVLTYFASHEWTAARNDDDAGAIARQRLGELLVRSRRWYACCAIGFALLALALGRWYFHGFGQTEIRWEGPWIAAVVVSAGSLWLSPSIVLLEGCNYVAQVNALRLIQAIAGNIVVWGVIWASGGLWAVAASAAVRLAAEAYLVGVAYSPFLQRLKVAATSGPSEFSWMAELLPLQWKIGVQAVAAYFLWTAYTPIVSKYQGLELGGRMGMTLQAIATIQLVAMAWIQTRVPRIGALLAHGEYREAQSMFRSLLAICMGVYGLGSAAFVTLIVILKAWKPALAERVLDVSDVVLFEIGMGLTLLISALGTYVRAHKIDPFLWVGVFNAAVTGLLVWHFGKSEGPRGAALAHIAGSLVIMLPATILIYLSVVRSRTDVER